MYPIYLQVEEPNFFESHYSHMSRYNHEQAKILAWEALEKSKADTKLKKMQVSYKSLPQYLEIENYLLAAGLPTLLMTHVSFTGDDQSMH
jgi:hypothetical protein